MADKFAGFDFAAFEFSDQPGGRNQPGNFERRRAAERFHAGIPAIEIERDDNAPQVKDNGLNHSVYPTISAQWPRPRLRTELLLLLFFLRSGSRCGGTLFQHLEAIVIHRRAHQNINREALPRVPFIDATNRSYVAVIPAVCDSDMLSIRRKSRRSDRDRSSRFPG